MFRKFIIICLVISTFGYGVAWAFDGYLEVPQSQSGTSFEQLADGDTPAHDHQNNTDCDHCCHGSAHLLGIAGGGTEGLSANGSEISLAHMATMVSYLAIPASPPPRR